MDIPLTEKEFEMLIKILEGSYPSLYAKLWTYKMNYLNKEKKNGLS
jgi:hypothetical protein